MKAKYIHPQFLVIDLDATSVLCITTKDHVTDDEDPQVRTQDFGARDRIRIQSSSDIEIGGDNKSVF